MNCYNRKTMCASLTIGMLMCVAFMVPVSADAQPLGSSNTSEQNLINKTVNNVVELNEALRNAGSGDTIELSSSFDDGNFDIIMPNTDVVIDAKGHTSYVNNMKIKGAGQGNLTLKNFVFDGGTSNDQRVLVENSAGNVFFDNLIVKNATNGAFYVNTSSASTVTIINSLITQNKANNTASAIRINNGNVTIKNSTISENTGYGSGYECGAISGKNYAGTLTISNALFEKNINKCENTGPVGGALSFHYFDGHLKVSDSIFRANSTNGSPEDAKPSYDGGAIYIFDGRRDATVNINGTTFDSNIAYDDGGAVMIQGGGVDSLTTTISNSTFVNNRAYGGSGGNLSGGAVQFFKNGREIKLVNNINGSTFYNNTSGSSQTRIDQQGGAVGISKGGFLVSNSANLSGNLFVGNNVYGSNGVVNTSSKYKDVSNTTTKDKGSKNVMNVDGGDNPEFTYKDVLGTTPVLSDNYSKVVAGYNPEIIQTLAIVPDGLADNSYTGSVNLGTLDQRGFPRANDNGAVSLTSVGYDANGGIFNINLNDAYYGVYYTYKNELGKMIKYYDIGNSSFKETIKSKGDLQVTREGYTFKGWIRVPNDSSQPLQANDQLIITESLTLYAIWEAAPIETYTIIYDGNGHTSGNVPVDSNTYESQASATILGQGTILKDGYTFKGWYDSQTGNIYLENEVITIERTMNLSAVWEKNSEEVVPPVEPGKPDPKLPPTGVSSNSLGMETVMIGLTLLVINGAYRKYRKN